MREVKDSRISRHSERGSDKVVSPNHRPPLPPPLPEDIPDTHFSQKLS